MSDEFDFAGKILWKPSEEGKRRAHLTRFMHRHGIKAFITLMERSTEEVDWFTEAVLDYLDVQFNQPYDQVLDISEGIEWARWCVGGEMNIIHNCLDKYRGTPTYDRPAMVWENERGEMREFTYRGLDQRVNQTAAALRALGLGKGDAVGLYMPMVPEIAIALLAIAKIGGIILPLFSGYGDEAIRSRLEGGEAKALFTADGFHRRGAEVLMKPVADRALQELRGVEHVIVLRYSGSEVEMVPNRDHWWQELVDSQPLSADTEITNAEDPLMIIYTSGTTGRPKGALHTHCGFPVKAAQDMAFGTDIHPEDRIYWITDMGWMMGPWLVFGALILGASFVIYDGAPDYPGPGRLWELVEKHGITCLGLSPTLVRALLPHGGDPHQAHDLSSLRSFASTGEPWNPDPWMWLFKEVGRSRLPIINYSGGTEISGGILMGNPILPLKACAFSGPCPGMAADVFDESGQPVRNQVGELVIKAPWIGMTRGFWGDPDRYLETYWSRWDGIWVHGDFAAVDSDGMWYILGRSDDTIKIAGKRLGPAEVESVLVEDPAVVEAAAIGVPDPVKGNELAVFCVLSEGEEPSPTLAARLVDRVTQAMGKPLRPKSLEFVSDLPKTRNAKVMRRMIKSAYLGEPAGDTSALVNPECLEEIRTLSAGKPS